MIDLRHTLNDFLKDFGHCGYSIRPTKRQKGYGAQMLAQVCHIAKQQHMPQLQLNVETTNIASIKTILKTMVFTREVLSMKITRRMCISLNYNR